MKFVRHKIGELCHNVTDGEHGTVVNDENGDFYLLSNKNIKNGKIFYDEKDRRINNETFNKINKRTRLEKDDVVISSVGTIGKTAIIKDEILKYDFQRSVGIYKVNKSILLPEFLHYYFHLPYVQKRLINLSSGAVQKCLYIGDLKNIDIDLPTDFNYQKRIAKVLSDLDAKIELNNKINIELEAMAKLIYNYWFVQFDFPDENGNPYKSSGGKMVYNNELKREIPEEWEVGSFGDYCKSTGGYAFKSSLWSEEGALVVKIKDIQENYTINLSDISHANIEELEIENKFIAKPGDILIAMTGATIGKYAIVPITKKPLYVNQRVGYFNLGDNPTKKLPFLINSLNQEYFRKVVFRIATGAAQPNISNEQINNIKLIKPNDKPLNKYNKKMKSTYDIIINNQHENQKLSELRDFLLPMLMNGQVTVK